MTSDWGRRIAGNGLDGPTMIDSQLSIKVIVVATGAEADSANGGNDTIDVDRW